MDNIIYTNEYTIYPNLMEYNLKYPTKNYYYILIEKYDGYRLLGSHWIEVYTDEQAVSKLEYLLKTNRQFCTMLYNLPKQTINEWRCNPAVEFLLNNISGWELKEV